MTAAKILVVDDDPDLREAVAMALELIGHRVYCAANGAEALLALDRELPDIIMLDMKMPIMDGWQFARQARESFGARLPPILVLTAAENPGARAAEIDAQGWLGKPFDIAELREQVERSLSGRRESAG